MGSSTSKPRKGHKKPQHLPKVGTPQNLEWRHQGERDDAFKIFGGRTGAIIIAVLVACALVGLILINLP
jgi:hypothetical protein